MKKPLNMNHFNFIDQFRRKLKEQNKTIHHIVLQSSIDPLRLFAFDSYQLFLEEHELHEIAQLINCDMVKKGQWLHLKNKQQKEFSLMGNFHSNLEYLEETRTDGFVYAEITEHFNREKPSRVCNWGDGTIKTPDELYLSISWKIADEPSVEIMVQPSKEKTGFAYILFTKPIEVLEDLTTNFKEIIPLLKEEMKKNL